jgi:transcriptional regulator with XRE-family HTH domain
MNTADEPFGQRIERLREERGWTRQELARRARVSTRQIYLVEGGKVTAVRPDTLARYATAFGVSRQYLQIGVDIEPHEPLPDLHTYLQHTTELTENEIEQVTRLIHDLQSSPTAPGAPLLTGC